jgi:hypothetical protein
MDDMTIKKEFEKIKNMEKNYDERVDKGDIFIPKSLLQTKTLNIFEKLYLSIYFNYNEDVNITDSNMNNIISKYKLSKIKSKLIKLGYIKEKKKNIDYNELKEKTILLSHKGEICEWCKRESYVLHKHHYPIPARNGGRKTVSICPNCHYTYHHLEGNYYD